MSGTFSELAADVLERHFGRSSESEKYLIGSVLGAPPVELYAALASRVNDEVVIGRDETDAIGLRAVRLDNGVVIIPYLVITDAGTVDDPNRGNRWFNGKLRDFFDRGAAPGEVRVLVTFDDDPIETQTTAMDTSIPDTVLAPQALLAALTDESAEFANNAVRPLLQRVLSFVQSLDAVSAREIGLAAGFIRSAGKAASEAEAGEMLGTLPWLLDDPEIEADTADRRLARAWKEHRDRVDGWAADPDTDFEQAVRTHYDQEMARRLIAARHLGRVEWDGFNYPELEAALQSPPRGEQKISLDGVRPVEVAEASIQVTKRLTEKPAHYGAAALAPPGRLTVVVNLTRALKESETVHLIAYRAESGAFISELPQRRTRADGASPHVTFNIEGAPLHANWLFCEIVLTIGATYRTRYIGKADLALLLHDSIGVLPFEGRCSIEAAGQRFVAEDEPLIEVAHPDGTVSDPDSVGRLDEDGGEQETELVEIQVGEAAVRIPIVIELPGDEPIDEPAGEHSPDHAVLRFAAEENVSIASLERPPISFVHGRAQVTVGGRDFPLADFPELGRSRWRVEAEILASPETTNYLLADDGSLMGDERLEQLSMESLEPFYETFLSARREFFSKMVEAARNPWAATIIGTRLAAIPEATKYVDSYIALLNGVSDASPYAAEFERLLLMDSVSVPGKPGAFIAPSSPLAVAAQIELERTIEEWQANGTGSLIAKDVDLISPRFAVPLLEVDEAWCESRLAPYPWRKYTPRGHYEQSQPEPFLAGFITRRIEAFLEVHPVYRDQRRTLTLAFINPGHGSHVLDGLYALIQKTNRTKGPSLEELPRFEVQLFTADEGATNDQVERLGSEIDRFMTEAQEGGEPTWLDQELMRRLVYTKAPIEHWIANPSAFAHIAFIQDYFRPSKEQSYSLTAEPTTGYARGLAFDLERTATVQANDIVFASGIWIPPEGERSSLDQLVARCTEIAAAASGMPVQRNRAFGVVTRVPKQTIPALYERAVWVVHLDRHIGLELFSPQRAFGEPPAFILDHTDQENLQESGFDAITATAMVEPYLVRIGSIFAPLLDAIDEPRAAQMLRWLNVLSGRWALQLLQSGATQVKERLGSVIAFRLLADRERIFADAEAVSVVVTLDELLRVTGKEGLRISEGWAAEFDLVGGASDDLLFLRVPLSFSGEPKVFGRVIEVKYTESVAPAEKAWVQVSNTHEFLSKMFTAPGVGRAFRARALAKLLKSYVSRMDAYGLLPEGLRGDARYQRVMNLIAEGRFEFVSSFRRDRDTLIGDFVSVEPNYSVPLLQPAPYTEAGSAQKIGRIRVGRPLIEALVGGKQLEALAGDYAPPAYGEERPDAAAAHHAESEASSHDEATNAVAAGPADDTAAPGEEPSPDEEAAAGATVEEAGDSIAQPAPEAEEVSPEPGRSKGKDSPKIDLSDRLAISTIERRETADQLDQVFARYQLPVRSFDPRLAIPAPNVVRYRTRMLEGGTIGALEARGRDIQREMGAVGPVYIGQEPPYVVVDVPRQERIIIRFADVRPALPSDPPAGTLPVILGVEAGGAVRIADLAEMPHLLVAGTTGSGKSVFLTGIGACLALLPTSRLELVVVDIKGLDFAPFSSLPHLRSGGLVDDPAAAVDLLEELMRDEVEERKRAFRESGARQIGEHYERTAPDRWPKQIVILIDEYAQLVSASGGGRGRGELESLIQQYAQVARAYGIYLVLATQRPSIDVLTGRIKANLPARAVFRLPSFNDSRTVIDTGGAEKLLGAGDMLFYRDGAVDRLQAVLTAPEDLAGASGST